eukprot:scaffold61551_cov61-Phaeocystis_antarctica.AAC.2
MQPSPTEDTSGPFLPSLRCGSLGAAAFFAAAACAAAVGLAPVESLTRQTDQDSPISCSLASNGQRRHTNVRMHMQTPTPHADTSDHASPDSPLRASFHVRCRLPDTSAWAERVAQAQAEA